MAKVNTVDLIEEDKLELIVEGLKVSQCPGDYAFSITIWEDDEFNILIRIESDFIFKSDEYVYKLCAKIEPLTICTALSIMHHELKFLIAYKIGELKLVFKNGDQINVPKRVYQR